MLSGCRGLVPRMEEFGETSRKQEFGWSSAQLEVWGPENGRERIRTEGPCPTAKEFGSLIKSDVFQILRQQVR